MFKKGFSTMADTTTPVQTTATNQDDVPCCPQLPSDTACDVLDYHYRLMNFTIVQARDQNLEVPVEVKIHVRFERCPGPMTLGVTLLILRHSFQAKRYVSSQLTAGRASLSIVHRTLVIATNRHLQSISLCPA